MRNLDEVNRALQKIARGTGIVFAGTVATMLLTFLSRVIIARYFDRYQYGSFTLTITILSIAMTVAIMGFQSGIPRELSRYRMEVPEKISALISTALLMTSVTSLIMTAVTAILAPHLGLMLNDIYLPRTLRLASPALPSMALLMILVAISRGFGRVRENLYYRNILSPLLFLTILVAGLFLGLGFTFVFIAYVFAQFLTMGALAFEMIRLGLLPKRFTFDRELGKELFIFSLPLLLTGILDYVMGWTDSIMLGYYFDPDVVGLYNGAAPIARLIPLFLNSMGFLYIPIATTFFTTGNIEGLKKLYRTTTRWVFLLTFPVFVFIFAFPEVTIGLFFGSKYVEAGTALRILAAGFVFHVLLGLNGMSLTVIGETNANLVGNFFASVANVVLNILLIPIYGIEGAATATAVSYIIANIFRTSWLYKKTGVHPFSRSYLKQLFVGIGMIVILKLANVSASSIWAALGVLVIFFVVYFALILVLRSVEKEDIELLFAVEKKFGVSLGMLRKILERFV
ncbi:MULTISPECIES: flippase [unclassified Thermococcus]|uniref:flippase n=1 Tax=unclassified Thermococcus TaxID=2627626 RepID=UPI003182D14C